MSQFGEMKNFYTKHAEKTLQENKNFLDEIRKEVAAKDIFSQDLLNQLDDLISKYRDRGPFEKLILAEKLYSASAIINLGNVLDSEEITDDAHLYPVFLFGYYCGEIGKNDPELISTKLYTDYYHSQKSKSGVEKRWANIKKQLKEASEIADKKWKEGDDAFHNEMAEYLENMTENGQKKFPDLTKSMLVKGLRPIAKKYNRLFGLKGKTKNMPL